jgi:hypothetical protein
MLQYQRPAACGHRVASSGVLKQGDAGGFKRSIVVRDAKGVGILQHMLIASLCMPCAYDGPTISKGL